MKRATVVSGSDFYTFPYFSLRNISCPDDTKNNRKIIVGQAPAQSILGMPTDENVRDYLLDVEGKQRRRPTEVHKAIHSTLVNHPDNFSVLNGGVVIVARGHEVDETNKCVKLLKPSIINGAQTQGTLKDFYEEIEKTGETPPEIYIKFELIVTEDDGLIAETSIARNFQNDVTSISISGRLGELDELEQSLQAKLPHKKLRKSETDISDEYLPTERLLQILVVLTPDELWLKEGETGNPNKAYAFGQKSKCLKDFRQLYNIVKGKKKLENKPAKGFSLTQYKELYQFYLDIAAQAYQLHEKWKAHQEFKGTRLRSLMYDPNGNIKEVPDGIVFPILASLSVFCEKTNDGWNIEPPNSFLDKELIEAAKTAYMEIAKSDPAKMGKTKACYTALSQITSLYKRLST